MGNNYSVYYEMQNGKVWPEDYVMDYMPLEKWNFRRKYAVFSGEKDKRRQGLEKLRDSYPDSINNSELGKIIKGEKDQIILKEWEKE